jgi:hypothetical protein
MPIVYSAQQTPRVRHLHRHLPSKNSREKASKVNKTYPLAHGVLQVEDGRVGGGKAVVDLVELLEVHVVRLREAQLLQHAPSPAQEGGVR